MGRIWTPEELAVQLGPTTPTGGTDHSNAEPYLGHTHITGGGERCVRDTAGQASTTDTALSSGSSSYSRLSERHRQLLLSGQTRTHGEDRSPDRMSLALAFHRAGYTLADYVEALTDSGHGASRWYRLDHCRRTRPYQERMRLIETDWNAAVAWALDHPAIAGPHDARDIISDYLEAAARRPWPGAGGPTERVVLHGAHQMGLELGRVEIDFSVRDAAMRAGVSVESAASALRRLTEAGWLRLEARFPRPKVGQLGTGSAHQTRELASRTPCWFPYPDRPNTGQPWVKPPTTSMTPSSQPLGHLVRSL